MNFSEEQRKRISYLQEIANKYGDFRVAYLKKLENGEILRTKWHSVIDSWHTEEGLYFLSKANNREPLPNELFIDLDDEVENETREETFNNICNFLEQNNETYIGYKSGSKGYHIHVYIKELSLMPKNKRESFKEAYLKKIMFADKLKYSDHAMLAIENVPHWKTGETKTRVRANWEILLTE